MGEFAEHIIEGYERAKASRAADMPTARDAINAMMRAYTRLEELGWRPASYCPKDGSWFEVIEPGSVGIHDCAYFGEWPDGGFLVAEAGDLWPSRPCLFRLKPATPGETSQEGA